MGQFEQLENLAQAISARAAAPSSTSYTAQLLAKGVERCAKKFGEEAVELCLAAVQGKRPEAAAEAADVFYHLLVLLQAAGVHPDAVMAELKRREGMGGLAEKASRTS